MNKWKQKNKGTLRRNNVTYFFLSFSIFCVSTYYVAAFCLYFFRDDAKLWWFQRKIFAVIEHCSWGTRGTTSIVHSRPWVILTPMNLHFLHQRWPRYKKFQKKNIKKYFKNIIKKKKSQPWHTLTTKKKRKNLTCLNLFLLSTIYTFFFSHQVLHMTCTLLQLHLCTLVVKFEHTYMREGMHVCIQHAHTYIHLKKRKNAVCIHHTGVHTCRCEKYGSSK